MPNIINNIPENLLISTMILSVSLSLNFPAKITFNTSALIFKIRQVEKIITLSLIVLFNEAVAAVNQKSITAGFNVLIKNPESANLACVPLVIFIESSCSERNFCFLKKKKKTPIPIKNKLPTKLMVFWILNNSLTNCEKAFPKITHRRSLTQTPATKLKPPARPLVMLCFMIAKITGPTEKSKIILIARPCSNALIIKKIGDFIFGEDRKKLFLFINWYGTARLTIHDAFCYWP